MEKNSRAFWKKVLSSFALVAIMAGMIPASSAAGLVDDPNITDAKVVYKFGPRGKGTHTLTWTNTNDANIDWVDIGWRHFVPNTDQSASAYNSGQDFYSIKDKVGSLRNSGVSYIDVSQLDPSLKTKFEIKTCYKNFGGCYYEYVFYDPTTPPAGSDNLRVTNVTAAMEGTSIKLNWTVPRGDVDKFRISILDQNGAEISSSENTPTDRNALNQQLIYPNAEGLLTRGVKFKVQAKYAWHALYSPDSEASSFLKYEGTTTELKAPQNISITGSDTAASFGVSWQAPANASPSGYEVRVLDRDRNSTGAFNSSIYVYPNIGANTTTLGIPLANPSTKDLKFEVYAKYDLGTKKSLPLERYYPEYLNGNISTNTTAPAGNGQCKTSKACMLTVNAAFVNSADDAYLMAGVDYTLIGASNLGLRIFAQEADANTLELIAQNPGINKANGIALQPYMMNGVATPMVYKLPVKGLTIGKEYKLRAVLIERDSTPPANQDDYNAYPDMSKVLDFTVKAEAGNTSTSGASWSYKTYSTSGTRAAVEFDTSKIVGDYSIKVFPQNDNAKALKSKNTYFDSAVGAGINTNPVIIEGIETGKEYTFRANIVKADRLNVPTDTDHGKWLDIPGAGAQTFTIKGGESGLGTPSSNANECKLYTMAGLGDFKYMKDSGSDIVYRFVFSGGAGYRAAVYKVSSGSLEATPTINWTDQTQSEWEVTLKPETTYEVQWYDKATYNSIQAETDMTKQMNLDNAYKRTYKFTTAKLNSNGGGSAPTGSSGSSVLCSPTNKSSCYSFTVNGKEMTLWDLFPAGMSREEINKLINSAPKADTMAKFPTVTYKTDRKIQVKWDDNDFLGWVQWDPSLTRPDGGKGDWKQLQAYSPSAECAVGDRNYQIRYTKVGANPNFQDIINKLKEDRDTSNNFATWPVSSRLIVESGNGMEVTLPTDEDYAVAVTRYCGNRAADPSPFVIIGKGKTTGQIYGQTTFQQISAQTDAIGKTPQDQCKVATVNGQTVAVAKPAAPQGVTVFHPRDVADVKINGGWVGSNPVITGVYYLSSANEGMQNVKWTAFVRADGTAYRISDPASGQDDYNNFDMSAANDSAQIKIKKVDGTLKEWVGMPLVGFKPGTYDLGLAYTDASGVMSEIGWTDQKLVISPYNPPSTVSAADLQVAPTGMSLDIDEASGIAKFKWNPVAVENITGYEIGEGTGNDFSSIYYISAEKYRDWTGLAGYTPVAGLAGTRPDTEFETQLYRRGTDENPRPFKFSVRPTYNVYKRKVQTDPTSPVVDENGKTVGEAGAGIPVMINQYGPLVAFPEKNYPVKSPIYVPNNNKEAFTGCRINASIVGSTDPFKVDMTSAQDVKVQMTLPANTIEQPQMAFIPKYYLSNGASNLEGVIPADTEFKSPDCTMMTFKNGFYGSANYNEAEYPVWEKSSPNEVDYRALLTDAEYSASNAAQKDQLFQTKWDAQTADQKKALLQKIGIYINPTEYGHNGVPKYQSSNGDISASQKQQFLNDQILGYLGARNEYKNTCEFTIPASQLKQGTNTFTVQGFLRSYYNEEMNNATNGGLQEITNKCTNTPPRIEVNVALRSKPTIINPTISPDDSSLAASTDRDANYISTSNAVIGFTLNDTTNSAVTCKIKDSTTNTPQTFNCQRGSNTYKHALTGAAGQRTITIYAENSLGENTEWSQNIVYENMMPEAVFTGMPTGEVDATSASFTLGCDAAKGQCKSLRYIVQPTEVSSTALAQLTNGARTCSSTTQCSVSIDRGESYTKVIYAVMTTRGGATIYSTPRKIEFKRPTLPNAGGPGTNPDTNNPTTPTTPVDTTTNVPAGAPTIEVNWGASGSYINAASITPTVKVSHTADSVVVVLYKGGTEVARKTINKAEYNTSVTLGALALTANSANALKVEANATGATEKSQATATITHDGLAPAVVVDPTQLSANGKVLTWNFKVTDASPVTQVKVAAKNTLTGERIEETLTLQSNGQYTYTLGSGAKKLIPGHKYMLDIYAIDAAGNGGTTPNGASSETTIAATKREEKNPLLQLLYIGDYVLAGNLVNVKLTRGTYVYTATDMPKGPNLLLSDIMEKGFANTTGQKASKLPSGTYQVEVSSKENASQKYTFSATIAPYYYSVDGDINGDGRVGLIDQVLKVHGESTAKYIDKDSNSELQEDFGKLVSAIQNAVNQNIRLFYRL